MIAANRIGAVSRLFVLITGILCGNNSIQIHFSVTATMPMVMQNRSQIDEYCSENEWNILATQW